MSRQLQTNCFTCKELPNTAPLRGSFDMHPPKGVHYAQVSSVKAAGQGRAGE